MDKQSDYWSAERPVLHNNAWEGGDVIFAEFLDHASCDT